METRTEVRAVEEVTMWRTRDGKVHSCRDDAEHWAQRLDDVDAANEMLAAGATVADAARRAGLSVAPGSVLERITGQTPLIVSHYQCRDEPGYKVCRIDPDLRLFVYGHAGSWSGPYGNKQSVSDVERYATTTLERATPTETR